MRSRTFWVVVTVLTVMPMAGVVTGDAPPTSPSESQRTHQVLPSLPDLLVDNVGLDDVCHLVVTLKNVGGTINAWEHQQSTVQVVVGQHTELFYLGQGRQPADPSGVLMNAGSRLSWNTGIVIHSRTEVSVTVNHSHSVNESNGRNNELKGVPLSPSCRRPQGQAPEGESAWCCLNREVFPAPPHECEEVGGRPFDNNEQAHLHCRGLEALRHGEIWCCLEGEAFPALPHECEEAGGRIFDNPEEAHHYCRLDEGPPIVPLTDQTSPTSGWCCRDGEVFQVSDEACIGLGGRFSTALEPAELDCGPRAASVEDGWCCREGELFPAPAPVCRSARGVFFGNQTIARQQCTANVVERGWCCVNGEVSQATKRLCHARGGDLFASRDDALKSSGAVWRSYSGTDDPTLVQPVPRLPQLPQSLDIKIEDVSPGPNAVPDSQSTQWGRMLALAGSGKEQIVGPVTSWSVPNGPKTVEHLAARTTSNDLMVYYWQPGQDWKAVNVSDKTRRKIAGPPVSWTSKEGKNIVEHLAAQGPNGELLVFWWQSGHDWKVVDVSAKTGRKISGGLTAWKTPVEHLGARSPNGHLLVFLWQPHTDWVVVDVTKETGRKVASDPVSWNVTKGTEVTEHLAARSAEDELLVFYWSPDMTKWKVVDVTAKTGHKVAGAATAWTTPVEHLAARAPNGDLLVFLWQPHTDWVVVNVSKETGHKVKGDPVSWTVDDGAQVVEHLAIRSTDDELLVFYWAPDMNRWKTVNVSAKTGPRIADRATAWTVLDGDKIVEHVAAQARNGDLMLFYWTSGQDWKPMNVTTKAACRVLYGAAPKAGVWRSDDYGNTWRQPTRPQPALGMTTVDGLKAPTVLDVAVSPTDPDVVLAAVRDDQRIDGAGGGIYYSANAGRSWKIVYQGKDSSGKYYEASQIRFAPDDPKLVYAAVGTGIVVSTDAGASWKPVIIPSLGSNRIWHIAIGPDQITGRRLYACGDGKMWHSADGGKSWRQDAGPSLKAGSPVFGGRVELAVYHSAQIMEVEPGKPDHVYLAYRHAANGPRFFHQHKKVLIDETDGKACNSTVTLTPQHQKATGDSQIVLGCGESSVWLGDFSAFKPGGANAAAKATWTQMPGPPVYWGVTTPSGRTYLKVHANRTGYLLFFADRTHLHVCEGRPTANGWHRLDGIDISQTWEKAQANGGSGFWNQTIMHMDPHAILLSPDLNFTLRAPSPAIPAKYSKNKVLHEYRGGRVWVANDGGVYLSEDGTKSWKLPYSGPKTLYAVNLAGVAVKGQGPGLYMGVADNDDFFTLNGGKKWLTQQGRCADCGHWFADPAQPYRLVEMGAKNRRGESFFYHTSPFVTSPPDASNISIETKYNYPKNYVCHLQGDGRVIVQTAANEVPLKDGDVFIFQDRSKGRFLVRAKDSISSNTFSDVGPKLPNSNISQAHASGGHTSTVFYVTDNKSVWRYPPAGQGTAGTWQKLVPGGGANLAWRLFANPYDPKNVYIVDSDGIKRSDNGGLTWKLDTDLTAHLTNNGTIKLRCYDNVLEGSTCSFNDLVVDPSNPKRRFALGMAGVFYTKDSTRWVRLLDTVALPSRPVSGYFDPITKPEDPALYVACEGRGVLKIHPIP